MQPRRCDALSEKGVSRLVREMLRRLEYRVKLHLRIFAHGCNSVIPGFLFPLLLHRRPFGSILHGSHSFSLFPIFSQHQRVAAA